VLEGIRSSDIPGLKVEIEKKALFIISN